MSKKRRKSGLFRKYFITTISIIFASFVFVGGALLIFVSGRWINEKYTIMADNTKSVAKNTSDVLESDYMGENGRASVTVICNTLSQISSAIDADVFITNLNGDVVYCKDNLQSNMALYTGNCMFHKQYKIPQSVMEHAKTGSYRSPGTLGASLSDVNLVTADPVIVNGQTVAVVFSTYNYIDGLLPYVKAIFTMFFYASLIALAVTFTIAYALTKRLTKPLLNMSAIAKQYANGDFSERVTIKKSRLGIRREDEMDEMVTAFNSMAQALATLEMSRRSFVANVSHELKTPMTTIGGFIDGILDGTISPEKEKQYLTTVSDEVKRLSRLVTGMLNMSKIEAGELDLKPKKFDISEMIFRTLLSFEQLIEKKHIEIRGLEDMQANPVFADPDMINQVIYNLVDNAIKFTPDCGYIAVSSKADQEKAIIKIRNSGKGIPSEEKDKIFERFYKVDKSRSYDVKGAGMGLYIVKTIVELHGGQISVASEEGEYAEFIFNLPII